MTNLESPAMGAAREQEADALVRGLAFSTQDLEANRLGTLSTEQRARFQQLYRPVPADNFYLWLALMPPICMTMVSFVDLTMSGAQPSFRNLSAQIVFGLCISAFPIMHWSRARRSEADAVRDIRELFVAVVEGVAEFTMRRDRERYRRGPWQHRLCISGVDFPATDETARIFTNGRRYRVYFTDYRGHRAMLSAEPAGP